MFILTLLALAAETAATVTTLGTIATGGTTTALNVGIMEVGKSIKQLEEV